MLERLEVWKIAEVRGYKFFDDLTDCDEIQVPNMQIARQFAREIARESGVIEEYDDEIVVYEPDGWTFVIRHAEKGVSSMKEHLKYLGGLKHQDMQARPAINEEVAKMTVTERFEREEVDVVDDGFECPRCGENRVDHLVNEEGYVTCECGHKYNLNPIILQNPWSGEMVEVMETEITQDKLAFMATLMDDEVMERIHTFDDCDTPGAFFRRYVDIVGPVEAGKIWFA